MDWLLEYLREYPQIPAAAAIDSEEVDATAAALADVPAPAAVEAVAAALADRPDDLMLRFNHAQFLADLGDLPAARLEIDEMRGILPPGSLPEGLFASRPSTPPDRR